MKKPYRQILVRENIAIRAKLIQAVRLFFIEAGYLEVETPIRIPAPAPEAHIDAESSGSWFLQTSPELCMKRLLSAGYDRIFQICKCFRQGERGSKHLPELTMLEWYVDGIDYFQMMQECEKLILFISHKLGRDHSLCYQDYRIDLRPPWNRMTVKEAFHRYSPIILETAIETNRFDEMMAIHIEPHLGKQKPLFLFEYPRQFGALARLSPQDPTVAERFELYIAGMELCNAFTELTDKKEQRRRFSDEQNHRSRLGKTVYPVDDKFLDALSDMPEASGNALGIDRLTMLFVDTTHIDDVVAFIPEDL